jgi:Dyp-type peroxidase family
MTVDLKEPLDSGAPGAASVLDQLQANILKAHVRDHLSVLLLSFGDEAEAKRFLRRLAVLVKSAARHLEEIDAHKTDGTPGTTYVGVGLSSAGYAAIGIGAGRAPADPSFRRGMGAAATVRALADPPPPAWEAPYRAPIHAIVLVGDAYEAAVGAARARIEALLPGSVTVVGEETGLYQRNHDDDGIEHFGYVDGRSQPLFLTRDIEKERATTDGADVWKRAFGLDQILVADRLAPHPAVDFGSYLVFRKLEQNVQRFKEQEERLADALGLEGEDRERAGALLVGRFEDGTPVTLQREGGAHHPVMNDFTYAGDADGMKCPHYAHIRKVNPRTARTRRRLMARRGQTYGVRCDDPSDDVQSNRRPTGGVGLLFMAFNSNIRRQFEDTQRLLANADGPGATGGADPVIGQGPRTPVKSPVSWGGTDLRETDPVAQAVTMKGGEYFFMPSIAYLRDP